MGLIKYYLFGTHLEKGKTENKEQMETVRGGRGTEETGKLGLA